MNNVLDKKTLGVAISFASVALLFLAVSFFAKEYDPEIRRFVGSDDIFGMAVYVLVTASSIVAAPVSTIPLIPLASQTWGWFVAGILSILGWLIGSQIAFHLARRFGKPFVRKMASVERLAELEGRFSGRNLFWTVVLLRMTVPVDVLSYALGLFSRMRAPSYFWATLIGITPFAFAFAYAGTLPPEFQVATLFLLVGVVTVFFLKRKAKEDR